jgi:hypothetical protein
MKKIKFKIALTALAAVITFTIVTIGAINAQAYKRQSNKENRVRVDVLPVQLVIGKPIIFDIKMNTHSVELNSDLVTGSVVQDDSGRVYNALEWDGTLPGSHHRSGVLAFTALKGTPKSVTLIIKGVSNVPERIYKWILE